MFDAPLLFQPILVPKVWGGCRLESLGKNLPAGKPIGESWELADLPGDGPSSVVASGPHAGRSLRELLDTNEHDILGDVPLNAQGRFPLLIKFLDACDNLSVQVHPDQAWAETHPGAYLKSEAWVVMNAQPGSRIWAGVSAETTEVSMRQALHDDRVTDCLQWRDAVVGSCHTLPSGTCHALGKGVLVAEVQTTSDTTFRLWDWGRTDRTMHVDEALACIDFTTPPPAEVPPTPIASGLQETLLTDTPWFTMRRIDCAAATAWRSDLDNAPLILMCVEGTAHVTTTGGTTKLAQGTVALLPAAMHTANVEMTEWTSIIAATPRAV